MQAHAMHFCSAPGCFDCEATPPRELCSACGGCGSSLTTHCPGRELSHEEMTAVISSRIDFKDGEWIALEQVAA